MILDSDPLSSGQHSFWRTEILNSYVNVLYSIACYHNLLISSPKYLRFVLATEKSDVIFKKSWVRDGLSRILR